MLALHFPSRANSVWNQFTRSFVGVRNRHGCPMFSIVQKRGEINSWLTSAAALARLGPFFRVLAHAFHKRVSTLAFCLNRRQIVR